MRRGESRQVRTIFRDDAWIVVHGRLIRLQCARVDDSRANASELRDLVTERSLVPRSAGLSERRVYDAVLVARKEGEFEPDATSFVPVDRDVCCAPDWSSD